MAAGLTCASFREAVPHGQRGSAGRTAASAATPEAPPAVVVAIIGAAASVTPVAAGITGPAAAVTWRERKEGAELRRPAMRAFGGRALGSAGRLDAVWARPWGRLASSARGKWWGAPSAAPWEREIPLWPYRHCQIHYSRLRRRHNRHRGCHQTHLKRTNRCVQSFPQPEGGGGNQNKAVKIQMAQISA